MSTPCEIPGEASPVEGAAVPVARSVAQDLEAIFPNEPRPQPQTLRLRARRRRGGERLSRGASFGRVGAAGALAAAALAGVSAGALLGRGTAPADHRPQPVLQVKTASALPNPGPLPAGPLHAPASPPPQILAAEARPLEAAPAKLHKASVQRRHASSAHRQRCHGAHCRASSSVMEADARLRRAYAAARDAGVSSTVMADYHARWEKLRHRAPREPRLVAARYDAMASDLNRMAARHEADRTTSHPGPWRALRTQIASLWR